MALVIKKFHELLSWTFNDLIDPRTDLFLAGSVFSPIIIIILYFYFVLDVGPTFMKHRKPFNLDKILIVYNALQVVVCVFIVEEGVRLYLFKFDWRCQPIDFSDNPDAVYLAYLGYLYYMVKIVDLLDTVFFVLRKKQAQVTFLHIYHHFGMVAIAFGGCRFLSGGHSSYLVLINCFVHAVMYFYYLMTAYNKKYRNSIWWKKHITQLQLGQFISLFLIYGQIIFRENCKYPKITQVFFLPQLSIMIFLFSDFYYKNYIKKPKPNKDKKPIPDSLNDNVKNK